MRACVRPCVCVCVCVCVSVFVCVHACVHGGGSVQARLSIYTEWQVLLWKVSAAIKLLAAAFGSITSKQVVLVPEMRLIVSLAGSFNYCMFPRVRDCNLFKCHT